MSDLLPIPFDKLYALCRTVDQRIHLLALAKEYHIHAQNFEEAMMFRNLERELKAEVSKAVGTMGKDAFASQSPILATESNADPLLKP